MPVHPIAVVDRIIEEYRSYLLTELRASDPTLRQALTEALDRPGFLAQEPFFQAHRPFKEGKPWAQLGLDGKLAKVMEARSESETAFLHQSDAIEHLLSKQATPLVVTTGTGSGKTECFLLPAIQNAIEDAVRFKQPGLTAILVYPMNALANDQETRIREYLEASGHTYVQVERYDRSTTQEKREAMRKSPPHLLLTNYMMLEYLLVRPADREAIFANHRCRFIVLDEVHTYRGSLGANIALLLRRLQAHLRSATQGWNVDDKADARRFPKPLLVATSATIKSIDETGLSQAQVKSMREQAVQAFVADLTGYAPGSFKVLSEELRPFTRPAEAHWPPKPPLLDPPDANHPEAVRRAAAKLAGLAEDTPLEDSVRRAAIFWTLAELLSKKPLSVSGIVSALHQTVPERQSSSAEELEREVRAALYTGAALGSVGGALRLRAHRFVRGGWRFHRCVDPACGRLYPMGEGNCVCGMPTAPLLLCRACGADALDLAGSEDPESGRLTPRHGADESFQEWLVYDRARLATGDSEDEEAEGRPQAKQIQMKGRPVFHGSFDPATGLFSKVGETYAMKVSLAPARNRCLVCGTTVGSGSVLTPVALGTSAALRVLSEGVVGGLAREHQREPVDNGGKERILIFADSRQDAAHQARFITYAGRYDRMRRRLVRLLRDSGGELSLEKAAHGLMLRGFQRHDNPHLTNEKVLEARYLNDDTRKRAIAWEAAPLLDDLAVSANYRATVFNLGLVGIRYGEPGRLETLVEKHGASLRAQLGLQPAQLVYLCRCILDEMRVRRAFGHPMLRYHPMSPECPEEIREADWERRIKAPVGYPWDAEKHVPVGNMDQNLLPDGVSRLNAWRAAGRGGSVPKIQRIFTSLLTRMGGAQANETLLLGVLELLVGGGLLDANTLRGRWKEKIDLLQVRHDAIDLVLLKPEDRLRCSICNVRMPFTTKGAPCRACHGTMEPWDEQTILESRYVQRILAEEDLTLVAREHTAQVTGDGRLVIEQDFKAPASESAVNVLACSPTLEMGIDVGGLDAVLMRNVPPRPDNYAQRGGRAGRRSRVGIVVGYARNTPHDQYFYDKPAEMIAGEVAAPAIGLGNRDVVIRHLNAIALGAAEPGLAGRMLEYISFKGEKNQEAIDGLIDAFESQIGHAADLAMAAWDTERILEPAGLGSREKLIATLKQQSERIRDVFDRVQYQVQQLQQQMQPLVQSGTQKHQGLSAIELIRRLLGQPDEKKKSGDADDRSAGHPMRRFAEFGILPGYEFPSEPATLRLLGDRDESEPISVVRRFGLAQYQPEAPAHARGKRWRVCGLDMTSPWNPRSEEPGWAYRVCGVCRLSFDAQQVSCPRCGKPHPGGPEHPAYEFGGFLAVQDDAPVLEEEERIALAANVRCSPQWNADIRARYLLPTGWLAEVRSGEEIRWINEWKPPAETEAHCALRSDARGFYLCPVCGHTLVPPPPAEKTKGNKKAKAGSTKHGDPFGHAKSCLRAGQPPVPLAIVTKFPATTLRLLIDVPLGYDEDDWKRWGLSLGYALRTGMRHRYMLDGPEIEFELESLWPVSDGARKWLRGALTFIDPAVGGSGFLEHAVTELDGVAKAALDHLDHGGCESACYRCLKSYQNQRYHKWLSWPHAIPAVESLSMAPPEALEPKKGDVFDPKPWLEAFDAGVGSPLELRFLRAFEAAGLKLEKQVPISVQDGGQPITAADFAVLDKRIAVYVDGAAFHTGAALRRDKAIRKRLKEATPPWTVLAFGAADLPHATGELRKALTKD